MATSSACNAVFSVKSAVYNGYRSGQKDDPWGTPTAIIFLFDKPLPILTLTTFTILARARAFLETFFSCMVFVFHEQHRVFQRALGNDQSWLRAAPLCCLGIYDPSTVGNPAYEGYRGFLCVNEVDIVIFFSWQVSINNVSRDVGPPTISCAMRSIPVPYCDCIRVSPHYCINLYFGFT